MKEKEDKVADQRVQILFGTPVILANLEDQELNASLEESILRRRSEHPGFIRHNRGGWHSDMDFLNWGGDAARRLALKVLELADANTFDKAAGPEARHNWFVEAWANVNEAGALNLPHSHSGSSGCFWSAVYYVKAAAGDGGELVLYDPRGPAVSMHAPTLSFKNCGGEKEAMLRPSAGMLVLFPSWLVHAVSPWKGGNVRISVAINLSAQRRLRSTTIASSRLTAGSDSAISEAAP